MKLLKLSVNCQLSIAIITQVKTDKDTDVNVKDIRVNESGR